MITRKTADELFDIAREWAFRMAEHQGAQIMRVDTPQSKWEYVKEYQHKLQEALSNLTEEE